MITQGDPGITASQLYPNQGTVFSASGQGNVPASADSAAADAAAPQDLMVMQDLSKKEKEIQELDGKIDILRTGIKSHLDKSKKLQGWINKVGLGAFCPTTVAVMFAPMIPSVLGFPALAPVVRDIFFGLFLAEAAVIGGIKYFQYRQDKAITPMAAEMQELSKQKAEAEQDYKNIKEIKDMGKAVNGGQSDIVDDDDSYLVIDGLKLEKNKFSLLNPMYRLAQRPEEKKQD